MMRQFLNKILIFILCIAMVASWVSITSALAIEDRYSLSSTFLASITMPDSSAVKVFTPQDLYDIRNNMNGSYVLMNDIDLTSWGVWLPIGDGSFTGIFDGQGHVISRLKITGYKQNSGLFGHLDGAAINNLGLEDVEIAVSTTYNTVYAGGICGYSKNSSIENCYVTGSIAAYVDGAYVGGICGAIDNNSRINNCYNTGTISSSDTAGGICGIGNGTIDRSINFGAVSASSPRLVYAGGISGQSSDTAIISNCYNTAQISASTHVNYVATAGGISGSFNGTMYNCYNEGHINAYNSYQVTYAGGMCGTSKGNIANCYNKGYVSAISYHNSYTFAWAGGICGRNIDSGVIMNCYSEDVVLASTTWNNSNANAFAGGISGESNGLISNCIVLCDSITADSTAKNAAYLISYNSGNGKKSNNFSVTGVNGNAVDDANHKITINDARTMQIYQSIGWDFSTVWGIDRRINNGYPYLRDIAFSYNTSTTHLTDLISFVDPSACYIYVLDSDTKCGISGASVNVGSHSAVTDTNGLAIVSGVVPGSATSLAVSANNYITYTITDFIPTLAVLQPVVVYQDIGQPRIVSALLRRTDAISSSDVLTKMETFMEQSSESFTLTIDAISSTGTIVKCDLYQGGKIVKTTSGNKPEFTLSAKDFKPESNIYAKVTDTSGKTSELIKLNLKVAQNIIIDDSELKFSLGTNTGITIPGSVPYIGGSELKLDFGFIPAQFDIEDNKITLAIGVTDAFNVKKDYKKFKEAIDSNNTTQQLRGLINSSYPLGSFLGNIKPYGEVIIYAEGALNDGKWQTLTGKGLIQVGVKGATEYQTTIVVVPVVVTVGFDLNGQLTGEVKVDVNDYELTPQADLKLELKLEAKGGVGIAYVASVGAYGNATAAYTHRFTSGYNNFRLDGSFGAYAKVLFWEHKIPVVSGNLWMREWYSGSSAQSSVNPLDTSAYPSLFRHMYETKNYSVSARDYLPEQSAWLGANTFRLFNTSGIVPLQTSVYTEIEPLLAEANGSRVMVFLADDGSRDPGNMLSLNRTCLMYSVYNDYNDTWTAPQPVWDDGTADLYPDIYSDGIDIFVAWNNAETAFSDETPLEDVISALGVAVARFDAISRTFVDVVSISDTNTPSIRPQIAAHNGQAFVSWVELGSNDIFGADSSNTVLYSQYISDVWSAPSILVSGLNAVVAMDAGYVNGQPSIALITDGDNDLSTVEDRELSISTDFIAPVSKASNAVSSPMYAFVHGTKELTWYQDGEIYYTNDGTIHKLFDVPRTGLSDDYMIISNASGAMSVIFPASDGIYGYLYSTSTGWSESVSLLKSDDYVRFPNGFIEVNDGIYFAFNQAYITVSDDDFTEKNDLCAYRFSSSVNLRLNEVYHPIGGTMGGAIVPIGLDITNLGSRTVNNYEVIISCAGGEIARFTDSLVILPGETVLLDAAFTAPVNMGRDTEFNVTVMPVDDAEADESDNSCLITIGHVDLALNLKQYYVGSDSLLIANISNNSNILITDAMLRIREDTLDGPVLSEMKIETLQPFSATSIAVIVYSDNLDFRGGDSSVLFFEVASGENEPVIENNSGFIVVTASSDETAATLPGDVNGDGEVGLPDLVLLAQKLAGYPVDIDLDAAKVTATLDPVGLPDLVLLAQWLAGYPVTLGR